MAPLLKRLEKTPHASPTGRVAHPTIFDLSGGGWPTLQFWKPGETRGQTETRETRGQTERSPFLINSSAARRTLHLRNRRRRPLFAYCEPVSLSLHPQTWGQTERSPFLINSAPARRKLHLRNRRRRPLSAYCDRVS